MGGHGGHGGQKGKGRQPLQLSPAATAPRTRRARTWAAPESSSSSSPGHRNVLRVGSFGEGEATERTQESGQGRASPVFGEADSTNLHNAMVHLPRRGSRNYTPNNSGLAGLPGSSSETNRSGSEEISSSLLSPPTRPLLALMSAEDESALVPVKPWTVVLYQASTQRAVLFNLAERKLVVRRTPTPVLSNESQMQMANGRCPLCQRPWVRNNGRRRRTPSLGPTGAHEGLAQANDNSEAGGQSSSFIDREYFEVLSAIVPTSMEGSDDGISVASSSPLPPHSDDDVGEANTGLRSEAPTKPGSSRDTSKDKRETAGLSEGSFNQGYYDRFFVEERKLGRGLRGSVFLCQHVLDQVPLGQFAVKAIPVGTSHEWLVRMLKEVHLLERLKHSNIIEYKHAWLEHRQLTVFGPEVPCLFILMELANGGNLEEYIYVQWQPETTTASADAANASRASDSDNGTDIDDSKWSKLTAKQRAIRSRDRKRRLQQKQREQQEQASAKLPLLHTLSATALQPPSTTLLHAPQGPSKAQLYGGIGRAPSGKKVRYLKDYEIWCLFLDICAGLAHLHEHGIIHRDLKPPNLLLRYADPDERNEIPRILISDFGECEVLSDESQRERTGATGTLEFMPPELLIKDSAGNYTNDHSPKADMWSLGVVLYFLCYSTVPYTQTEDVDLLRDEIVSFERVSFPDHGARVPAELQSLIIALLSKNGRERPSVEDILRTYSHMRPTHYSPGPQDPQQQPSSSSSAHICQQSTTSSANASSTDAGPGATRNGNKRPRTAHAAPRAYHPTDQQDTHGFILGAGNSNNAANFGGVNATYPGTPTELRPPPPKQVKTLTFPGQFTYPVVATTAEDGDGEEGGQEGRWFASPRRHSEPLVRPMEPGGDGGEGEGGGGDISRLFELL